MSPAGGIWAPAALRLLRQTALTTTKMLRQKLAAATRPLNAELQPVAARASGHTGRQPIHPSALLRQQKRSAKWFSTRASSLPSAVRRFLSTAPTTKFDRTRLPVSTISRAVSQLPGRAPFASTLRPNLTAGAFPRTAGGYSATGAGRLGGARYFSHTPAAPAQVVQNVSQAVRAFWLSGQRARYDGVGSDGRSRYRSVSAAAEETRVRMSGIPKSAPGAYVDFRISPTVTALSPLGAAAAVEGVFGPTAAAAGFKNAGASLNAEGFLDVLSTDFARALRDLAAVMADLKKLSSGLGDLPIELQGKGDVLRVRFPGVDGDTVESLCDDVGVLRGVVGEDSDFNQSTGVPVALKFPFAPDSQGDTKTLTSPGGSMRSHDSALSEEEEGFLDEYEDNPWLLSSEDEVEEGYESLSPPVYGSSGEHCSEDFEGLEGIYRFLEECDRVRNPF
ncbi:hypothetical protein BR93DRAFT_276705 [Coniochaeta sp. PMI_546]|nr:hypothetical protein BR93DRAFT_276705 [Coniochaeta sp. PMI_546]